MSFMRTFTDALQNAVTELDQRLVEIDRTVDAGAELTSQIVDAVSSVAHRAVDELERKSADINLETLGSRAKHLRSVADDAKWSEVVDQLRKRLDES